MVVTFVVAAIVAVPIFVVVVVVVVRGGKLFVNVPVLARAIMAIPPVVRIQTIPMAQRISITIRVGDIFGSNQLD